METNIIQILIYTIEIIKLLWVPISSISKVFYSWIINLEFNL